MFNNSQLGQIDVSYNNGGLRGDTLGSFINGLYVEEMTQSQAEYNAAQFNGTTPAAALTYTFAPGITYVFDSKNATGWTYGSATDAGYQDFLNWVNSSPQIEAAVIAAYQWVNTQPKNSSEGIAGLILPALMLGVGALAYTGAGLIASQTASSGASAASGVTESGTFTPSAGTSDLTATAAQPSELSFSLSPGESAATALQNAPTSPLTQSASNPGSFPQGGTASDPTGLVSNGVSSGASDPFSLTSLEALGAKAAPLIPFAGKLFASLTGKTPVQSPIVTGVTGGASSFSRMIPIFAIAGIALLAISTHGKKEK